MNITVWVRRAFWTRTIASNDRGRAHRNGAAGDKHLWAVNVLNRRLTRAVGDSARVSVQNPITLPPHSEPQPDIVVLRADTRRKKVRPAADNALLVIEVADNTHSAGDCLRRS